MSQQRIIPITSWNEDEFQPSIPVKLQKVKFTKTAATFDDGISFDRWLEIGAELAAISDCCQWWIGDWLVHGKATFGDERYMKAADLSGYENSSLSHFACVASAIPICRRRQNLSWSHHAEVASLDTKEQEAALTNAEKNELSVHALRAELRGTQTPSTKGFLPSRWISTGIEKLKAMAQGDRRAEIKEALRPLVELYNTL